MLALIVDDAREGRRQLCHTLQDLGCEVHEADHARGARAAITFIGRPDVVLVTDVLEDPPCAEFVRELRARHDLEGVRILVSSTRVQSRRARAALEIGADDLLHVPCDAKDVRDKLALLQLGAPPH